MFRIGKQIEKTACCYFKYKCLMVYLAILIWLLGMLALPLGRLYAIWQKRRGNPYFLDADCYRRFMAIRTVLSVVLCLVALVMLLFIEKSLN